MARTLTIIRALVGLALLSWATVGGAHLLPNSEVAIAVGRTHLEISLRIPAGELAAARPDLAGAMRRSGPLTAASDIPAYLQRHLRLAGLDGRPWTVRFETGSVSASAPAEISAIFVARPPDGGSPRRFAIVYDGVIEQAPGHFALVYLAQDFAGGQLAEDRQLLGGLRRGGDRIEIDLGRPDLLRGFRSAVLLGMHHIAEGHDHLLFLIILLLAAPLRAQNGRWAAASDGRGTARLLVGIVSAFTIGHSLTLIGGAGFGLSLPAQPVEILIALSILISAVHAWRPVFAGREAIVAGGFGLVHGLAFATLIGHIGIDPWHQAIAIAGFNIGIELVQLLVVAATLPALLLLARTQGYGPIRRGIAAFAGLVATCWIVERAVGAPFAPAQALDRLFTAAPYVLVALTIFGCAAPLLRRFTSGSRTS